MLYADLLQKAIDSDDALTPPGSYVSKTVHGKKYWYRQTQQIDGARKQVYLGPETPDLLQEINEAKERNFRRDEILSERKRLVAMLSVSGATLEKGRPAKIIGRMADAGVFTAGGMLVGSFAFSCYGNMLGVSFGSELMRTEDMDFSMEREIEVGMIRQISKDILEVDPSFKFPKQVNPSVMPFEMIASDGFKVEFLTTKESPTDKAPVLIDRFAVHAQPMDYMDYLFENKQQAIMLNSAGILIKVPDPARFALHKLAVSQLRPIGLKTKSDKDVSQAASILEVLLEDNPGVVSLAGDALRERTDMMSTFVRSGLKRLPQTLFSQLDGIVPESHWDSAVGASIAERKRNRLKP